MCKRKVIRPAFCFLSVFLLIRCCTCVFAAVTVSSKSPGAFLVKTRAGMRIMAAITFEDNAQDFKEESYVVNMTMPDGRKINLSFLDKYEKDKEKSFLYFYVFYSLLDVGQAYKTNDLMGDFVFTLFDAEGDVLVAFPDFLIPFRDEAYEGMGDFDETTIFPKNGATLQEQKVVFKWNEIKGAKVYRILILGGEGPDSKYKNKVFDRTLKKTEAEVPLDTFAKGTYSWRLVAIAEEGSDWDNIVRYTREDDKDLVFYVE